MKKKSDWHEYIVQGFWVLSFLATILWIADANGNPLIIGINGEVYEPLTIVFTSLAFFTTWVYLKIIPQKKGKTPKDTIPQRRKVLIVATGLVFIFGLIIYLLRKNDSKKEATTNTKDFTQLECYFPEKFQKDTLYILVTRFEDYINKTETTCFGRSLRDRIDVKANKNNIPIKICYTDKFSPQTVTEVKILQKKYNADLVLWGRLKNVTIDCSEGDFCFLSQPSDTLIKIVKGEINIELVDLDYEPKISPSHIEQGNFHADSLSFDKWLVTIYNIKVGRNNPNLYLIDKDLTKKEQAEQHIQRGYLFYNFHKYYEAIKDYDMAVELNPNQKSTFYVNRGNAKAENHNSKEAISDYTKAINLNVAYSLAYYNRGNMKFDLRDYQGAILDYDEAIKINNFYMLAYYNRGLAKHKQGNYKEALIDYNKTLDLNPRYVDALINRGIVKDDLKDFKEALVDYGNAIKMNPENSKAFSNRGITKYNIKDIHGAILDFNKAIYLNPYFAEVYTNRGLIKYGNLHDFESAIIDFDMSIKLKPKYSLAYLYRGFVKEDLKEFKGAISDYSSCIRLDPNNSIAYYKRARAKYELKDLDGSLLDCNKSIYLNPNDSEVYRLRGIIKYELKDLEGSMEDFNKANKQKKATTAPLPYTLVSTSSSKPLVRRV